MNIHSRLITFFVLAILSISSIFAATININTATKTEITTSLKGVGDVKAQAIIDYREEHGDFKNINDLLNVTGIGQKTFEGIKDNIDIGKKSTTNQSSTSNTPIKE